MDEHVSLRTDERRNIDSNKRGKRQIDEWYFLFLTKIKNFHSYDCVNVIPGCIKELQHAPMIPCTTFGKLTTKYLEAVTVRKIFI